MKELFELLIQLASTSWESVVAIFEAIVESKIGQQVLVFFKTMAESLADDPNIDPDAFI